MLTLAQAYATLQIHSSADLDQVKRAYKRLALKHHPDKNPNCKQATEKFQQISEAYKRITEPSIEDEDVEFEMSFSEMADLFDAMFNIHHSSSDPLSEFLAEMMACDATQAFTLEDSDVEDLDDEDLELLVQMCQPQSNQSDFPIPANVYASRRHQAGKQRQKERRHSRRASFRRNSMNWNPQETRSNQEDEADGDVFDAPQAQLLALGAEVLVHGKLTGRVRFIGTTHYGKGEFVGIELDEAVGKNNGTVKGVKYFDCEPMYGLMVRSSDCQEL